MIAQGNFNIPPPDPVPPQPDPNPPTPEPPGPPTPITPPGPDPEEQKRQQMIAANKNFDNWSIPSPEDLNALWLGNVDPKYNNFNDQNIPLLSYDQFPQFFPGLDRSEAVERFLIRYTYYTKALTGLVPITVKAWAWPIPPYPEVEYPFYPVERLPSYYQACMYDAPVW